MTVGIRGGMRGWLLVALTVLLSTAARGQSGGSALADELFIQAKSLMESEQFQEACDKFEESQRLDPAVGTLLNLAHCHEKVGRFASAWTEYSEVVTVAARQGRPDRVTFAEERLKEIEGHLSKLTIVLPKSSDVEGLSINLNGVKLGRAALGVPLPVDPGLAKIETDAPGRLPQTATISIEQGPSSQTFRVPTLRTIPVKKPGTTPEEHADLLLRKKLRTAGLVTGGIGALGLAAGTVFGVVALSKNERSFLEGCDGNICDPRGEKLRNQARGFGNASTASFVTGGALLAAGTTLFLLGREERKEHTEKPPEVSLSAGPGLAFLKWSRAF